MCVSELCVRELCVNKLRVSSIKMNCFEKSVVRQHGTESNEAMEPSRTGSQRHGPGRNRSHNRFSTPIFSCFMLLQASKRTVLRNRWCANMELRVTKQWNQAGQGHSDTDPGGIDLTTVSQHHSFLVLCCCLRTNCFEKPMVRQHGAESNEAMEPSREE